MTEESEGLEILDLESKMNYIICITKTKALISCAVTTKLICAIVFAYADCWFSNDAVHFLNYDFAIFFIILAFIVPASLSSFVPVGN